MNTPLWRHTCTCSWTMTDHAASLGTAVLLGAVASVSIVTVVSLCLECRKRRRSDTDDATALENNQKQRRTSSRPDPDNVQVMYNPHSGALELAPERDKDKYYYNVDDTRNLPVTAVIINPSFLETERTNTTKLGSQTDQSNRTNNNHAA